MLNKEFENIVSVAFGNLNSFEFNSYNIFSDQIIEGLNHLSILIRNDPKCKNFSDLMTFGFWIRKSNLNSLQSNYLNYLKSRIGRGCAFNIAPSNVPMNGPFSMVFSLLAGNSVILKLSSSKFEQTDLFITKITEASKTFDFLQKKILIIRYPNIESITSHLLNISDSIIVWGSDDTIQNIDKLTNLTIKKLYFPNRNSICLISKKALLKCNKNEIKKLAQNFYNDTYSIDQNACSSPRVIYWLNDTNENRSFEKSKAFFIESLMDILNSKFEFNEDMLHYKLNQLLIDSSENSSIRQSNFDMKFNLISNAKINLNNPMLNRFGYFYEYDIDDLSSIFITVPSRVQTLTYFGFSKEIFRRSIKVYSPKGIDRIVPIGRALDIDLEWDGQDFIISLTRNITIL